MAEKLQQRVRLAFGLDLRPDAYAGTIAAILGFVIPLLTLANLLMLAVRDSFAVLVVAFILFTAAVLPGIAKTKARRSARPNALTIASSPPRWQAGCKRLASTPTLPVPIISRSGWTWISSRRFTCPPES
ncbi:MAG TPA: hypothetical protein VGR65_07995 [Casimicrobiaceae bacterium]|jgi:hypothetical protein|nr:hypothetical protein [Casimicrobiaceae bacterium]